MRTTAVYFTANPFNLSLQQPNDICTFLGLCGGRDIDRIRDLLLNHMSKTLPVPTMKVTFEEMILKLLFACSAQLTRFLCSLTQMETSMQCSVCTYIVSTLRVSVSQREDSGEKSQYIQAEFRKTSLLSCIECALVVLL